MWTNKFYETTENELFMLHSSSVLQPWNCFWEKEASRVLSSLGAMFKWVKDKPCYSKHRVLQWR